MFKFNTFPYVCALVRAAYLKEHALPDGSHVFIGVKAADVELLWLPLWVAQVPRGERVAGALVSGTHATVCAFGAAGAPESGPDAPGAVERLLALWNSGVTWFTGSN